jgi:CO/xanthine dehydrogenase Mo-binding subunit/aerobic-type carbon monoxide dehydrogenase small subunit (CoxS/CutS family)
VLVPRQLPLARGSYRTRSFDCEGTLIALLVNGLAHNAAPEQELLSVLRDELGLTAAKPGCGEGVCGACTVLVGGEPVRACVTAVGDVTKPVTTLEGLAPPGRLHPLQQAFLELSAFQCGYCTPGMIMSGAALLAGDPDPDEAAIVAALDGNVCRCCTYPRILRAIRRATELDEAPYALPEDPSFDRPERPWDRVPAAKRDWFSVLPDGLVVAVEPEEWSTSAGAWMHVDVDGGVTAFTGKVDVGQGNRTALSLLVAAELEVPVDAVRVVMGDTDLCPYDRGTFGSRSMPDAAPLLRAAAAAARSALDTRALEPGERRVEIAVSETGPPRPTESVKRRGGLEIVTGRARFPSDLTRPAVRNESALKPAPVVGPDEDELEAHLRSHPAGEPSIQELGDVERALADAAVRLDATYTTAYIAHVPLETRAALAEWDGDRLTVWTGTQRPFGVRAELAEGLGVSEDRVRVVAPTAGSAFGGKHRGEVAIEAARLSRAAGQPVKVRWSRAEEFEAAYVRPAAIIDVRSGAGSDGTLCAWDFLNIGSGAAGIGCPYTIAHQRLVFQPAESPLRQGSYRGIGATANHFGRESHLDELAHSLDADPVELRLRHLEDERLADVLRAAAERAGWSERSGLGIACGVEKGAYVATCAEVTVDDGTIRVTKLVTAFDCGAIVDSDNLVNQIEGATIMGLGGALFERVRFAQGRIVTRSLSEYRVPRFSDVPSVEVVLLDRTDVPSAGAGETPIVCVAPALANALFAATGTRVRSLPLLHDGPRV